MSRKKYKHNQRRHGYQDERIQKQKDTSNAKGNQ